MQSGVQDSASGKSSITHKDHRIWLVRTHPIAQDASRDAVVDAVWSVLEEHAKFTKGMQAKSMPQAVCLMAHTRGCESESRMTLSIVHIFPSPGRRAFSIKRMLENLMAGLWAARTTVGPVRSGSSVVVQAASAAGTSIQPSRSVTWSQVFDGSPLNLSFLELSMQLSEAHSWVQAWGPRLADAQECKEVSFIRFLAEEAAVYDAPLAQDSILAMWGMGNLSEGTARAPHTNVAGKRQLLLGGRGAGTSSASSSAAAQPNHLAPIAELLHDSDAPEVRALGILQLVSSLTAENARLRNKVIHFEERERAAQVRGI